MSAIYFHIYNSFPLFTFFSATQISIQFLLVGNSPRAYLPPTGEWWVTVSFLGNEFCRQPLFGPLVFFKLGHASQWILLYIYVCMYVVVHGYIYNVLMVGWRVYSSFLPLTETVYVEHDREQMAIKPQKGLPSLKYKYFLGTGRSKQKQHETEAATKWCGIRMPRQAKWWNHVDFYQIRLGVSVRMPLYLSFKENPKEKDGLGSVFLYIRPIVFLLPPYDSDVHSWFPEGCIQYKKS